MKRFASPTASTKAGGPNTNRHSGSEYSRSSPTIEKASSESLAENVDPPNFSSSFAGAPDTSPSAQPQLDARQETFPFQPPKKRRSALIKDIRPYEPVADKEDRNFTNRSLCAPPKGFDGTKSFGEKKGRETTLTTPMNNGSMALKLRGDRENTIRNNDTMDDCYQFMVGDDNVINPAAAAAANVAASREKSPVITGSHVPYGVETPPGSPFRSEPASAPSLTLSRRWRLNSPSVPDAHGSFQSAFGLGSEEAAMKLDGSGKENSKVLVEPTPIVNPELRVTADDFMGLPFPDVKQCVSREKLEDDTVSFFSVWSVLKSDLVYRCILFGARSTLLSAMPAFLLLHHPNTKHYFVAGGLFPVWAAMFVKPSFGAQVLLTATVIHTCLCAMTAGVFMNAVGAIDHPSAWWCGIIAISFTIAQFNVEGRRLMMMYTIIVLQMERTDDGTMLVFPLKYTRDMLIACCFAMIAILLPYPTLCHRQANETMAVLHKTLASGIGNATKSYWAPVLVDGRTAFRLIPFNRVRNLIKAFKNLIRLSAYEITEPNLNNRLRTERIQFIENIAMHLYVMTATASQRLEEAPAFRVQMRQEFVDFEKRIKQTAMEFVAEIISVLTLLGNHISPDGVVRHVNFDTLANKATLMNDLIEREQMDMLMIKKMNAADTNAFLRSFAFHNSLLDIAAEILKLEYHMKNFDPSKYPNIFRRVFDFVFYDLLREFWRGLPSRLTLATPYDVRMVKDGIKYSLAYAVACAFTLNYDKDNVYYFGMAILVRLAQQTAAETLRMGFSRIAGLCIGASFAFVTASKTHNLAQMVSLNMTFVFVAMCFALHPIYSQGAQYIAVVTMVAMGLANDPGLLLTRMTDNVFAFISYFIICTAIFPCDPVRVLWNIRAKIFIRLNSMTQALVTLGCSPITTEGLEANFAMNSARQIMGEQRALFTQCSEWMAKAADEPIIRGGAYPNAAIVRLLDCMNETASLHETLLQSMARLHRVRRTETSPIIRDLMELLRPFLLDLGKIVQRFFQEMIDSTEVPLSWSMEPAVHCLWKADMACRSLRKVTGHIQQHFFAAVHEVALADRNNTYLNSSFIESALVAEQNPNIIMEMGNDELAQQILAMSMRLSQDNMLPRDDLQAFNGIVVVSDMMLTTLANYIEPMLALHEFEKSRRN